MLIEEEIDFYKGGELELILNRWIFLWFINRPMLKPLIFVNRIRFRLT